MPYKKIEVARTVPKPTKLNGSITENYMGQYIHKYQFENPQK